METWRPIILFSIVFVACFHCNYGCQIEGVVWPFPVTTTILDTFRGVIIDSSTSGIDAITNISPGEGLNFGPYVDVTFTDSRLTIATNSAYNNYEENEVLQTISTTVQVRCTGGTSRPFAFIINVQDTNNNAPRFLPSNEFVFTISPPVPPGFEVTGCFNDLAVRDIDLTTQRIDFALDNPYFEIEYDAASSTTAKEFKAILRTKTLIRTITNPIELTITATDVDLTDDPPKSTTATVTIKGNPDFELPEEPIFSQPFYLAEYTNSNQLVLTDSIHLRSGFNELVQFTLEGDHKDHFELVENGNTISIRVVTPLTDEVLIERQILLVVRANREYTSGDSATVIVQLPEEVLLEFERAHYEGTIENGNLQVPKLILSQGYGGASVFATVRNEHSSSFAAVVQGNSITLTMTPLDESVIKSNSFIYLQVVASTDRSTATTIVTLEIIKDDSVTPVFNRPIYTGSYSPDAGLAIEPITIVQGYDETVAISLHGDLANSFELTQNGPIITLQALALPPEIYGEGPIMLSIRATKPRTVGASAAVVITLPADLQIGDDVSFEKVLYEGFIRLNEIQHERIIISGFDGSSVDLFGEHSSLFVARVANGVVTVQALRSVTLPADVTRLTLELHAAGARAVLLLNIVQADTPAQPSVTFTSETYVLTVEIVQTGLVGRVQATADNAEPVTYSLATTNEHLQTRLSINNEGELYLSAPANSGVYTFQVIATTVITRATGTATVHLTAEAVTVCGDDIVVPPLIILDRDEESAHNNLVVLDPVVNNGCHFSLTNRWPADQTWLYVNENGLHARAIDREHESIAFMALSQVQVELVLHCDSDNSIRSKRSERTDWLGPYDYGTKNWILTDTIPYNSRRSLVNLIVNDINDNTPIFVGKEFEPIPVGYPIDELEERILPRSLVELKATDADIGENAVLRYSSSASELAVAPTTGFVHVRSPKSLSNNQILTVYATDRRGEGLTGSIQLVVKLLDLSNIAVVTVKNAFLDDENDILTRLGEAVGYEVKTLRTVVISDDVKKDGTRNKREPETAAASLQLYVYGLIEREPVAVNRLAEDINNNAAIVSVIRTVTLEDHLEDNEINILERDIGLLVATIILSILLFMLILLIAIWYFLKWRKNRNYDQFSDRNSLASRNESLGELPKPDFLKPRLNIDDLKKSERRLQEMLNAPIEEVTVEPMALKTEAPLEAILNIPNMPDINAPIVIQSIDKLKDAEDMEDDEFGEINKTRRKSVVTFNENVEKIIHVQDDTDSSSHSGYDIYKF